MQPITTVETSENAKLGRVSATYASQESCPTDCPFRGAGCYAESGYAAYTTRRLNASDVTNAVEIARRESRAIDGLSGRNHLRLHVVGDSRTRKGTRLLASAAKRYSARFGRTVWTYTHAWRKVDRDDWGSVSVLASCETAQEVREARKRGYAAALVVAEFERDSAYTIDGVKVVPAQRRRETW